MAKKTTRKSPDRKVRADAQRNRERILDAAKKAFACDGASTSLDEIARHAGVGSGTLYRHFPSREDLIEAVYRNEVEKLVSAEADFGVTMPPLGALRSWMLLFLDHVTEKKLIIPALDQVPGGSMQMIERSRDKIHAAFTRSVQRAITSGDLRTDTQPQDFVRALVGIIHTLSMPGWEESARRLVDILIAGARSSMGPGSDKRLTKRSKLKR